FCDTRVEGRRSDAMMDGGAMADVVDSRLLPSDVIIRPLSFGVDCFDIDPIGMVQVSLCVYDREFLVDFVVARNFREPMVIGNKTMGLARLMTDHHTGRIFCKSQRRPNHRTALPGINGPRN